MNRPLRLLLAALALVAVLAAAGCGGGGGGDKTGPTTSTPKSEFSGAEATPPQPAAPVVLRNSLGKRVNLARYKGKAVLLTFLYTHCPDVCQLIAGHLHTALGQLGPVQSGKVKLVAVSTDPKGDTPASAKTFLADHQLTGSMDFLLGSPARLSKVWSDWNIVAKPDKQSPELIAHSALIYGISASGKVTTLYPSNFKPADVVHDVPLLAAR